MYQMKDFPKERIIAIREECGVVHAQQTRTELLQLFDSAKDQGDVQYVFQMLDEAEKLLEECRAKARAQLQVELDAWMDKEHEAANAEWEEWKAKWRADMENAKQNFAKKMGWT